MTSGPFIPFALPDLTSAESDAVLEVLRRGWITTGPRAKEFERRFAGAVGAPHCVAVSSCTAALHLALEAVGVRPGDEVIVPTMTFAASAEVVRYLGAVPVLVDVNASDHNVAVPAIERAITPRTRAIVPVHFGGVPADMDEIVALARPRGIVVVADAAHAFPSEYRGRNVGALADVTCFSFYATKTLTTGEGGAAVTSRAEWADRMRIMSLHGISRDAWKRYMEGGSWYYEIVAPGFKYNLGDIAAALGLAQLARAEAMRARREAIARRYDAAFAGREALELLAPAPDRTNAHHLYVIKLAPHLLDIDRNRFIEELTARGVGVSVHFIPLHEHPYYRETFGYRPESLPVAHDAYLRSISLPIYSAMTDEQVERVVEAVLEIADGHLRASATAR
ncbi:DegT/DnrJ/EryC1/StrS aminotransferase family protein [Anaeromyxobacter sp. Fw109-5]|uniref:DegT/DnrJ/EryC1/StrS family aminotransferase n=1 Tax=Anaeromyxobacter sp. (strain Fw109-5) TaxID=404589 RepID=UPI000158A6E3|nr:DegT/DnrJ/EryC1/StrS family aminotransferase [Anaeromyxobacter sp. Fw109-5]ABS25452.1 DegT/DnrJ/EryC1/StrS aminotransferase [Anaeromyxobacter sp. Fw109-5]